MGLVINDLWSWSHNWWQVWQVDKSSPFKSMNTWSHFFHMFNLRFLGGAKRLTKHGLAVADPCGPPPPHILDDSLSRPEAIRGQCSKTRNDWPFQWSPWTEILSDVLSDTYSDKKDLAFLSDIYIYILTLYLACFLAYIYIYSDIPSSILFAILSGILFAISSEILSDMRSDIWYSSWHSIRHLAQTKSHSAHCVSGTVGVRQYPHLAGGKLQNPFKKILKNQNHPSPNPSKTFQNLEA